MTGMVVVNPPHLLQRVPQSWCCATTAGLARPHREELQSRQYPLVRKQPSLVSLAPLLQQGQAETNGTPLPPRRYVGLHAVNRPLYA